MDPEARTRARRSRSSFRPPLRTQGQPQPTGSQTPGQAQATNQIQVTNRFDALREREDDKEDDESAEDGTYETTPVANGTLSLGPSGLQAEPCLRSYDDKDKTFGPSGLQAEPCPRNFGEGSESCESAEGGRPDEDSAGWTCVKKSAKKGNCKSAECGNSGTTALLRSMAAGPRSGQNPEEAERTCVKTSARSGNCKNVERGNSETTAPLRSMAAGPRSGQNPEEEMNCVKKCAEGGTHTKVPWYARFTEQEL